MWQNCFQAVASEDVSVGDALLDKIAQEGDLSAQSSYNRLSLQQRQADTS